MEVIRTAFGVLRCARMGPARGLSGSATACHLAVSAAGGPGLRVYSSNGASEVKPATAGSIPKPASPAPAAPPSALTPLFHHTAAFAGSLAGFSAMALLFPSPALGLPPLIASLAASAALVYGAHAAPFSRPRNVVGGHLVSGFAGSAVRFLLPLSLLPPPFDYVAACGLSVSLSVFLMLRTDTMHPPAAATGLIAGALGGEAVAAMGWLFAVQGAAGPAAVLVGTGWAWNRAVGTWLAARGTAAGWTSYPVGGKWI